jgi:hypothetical protein
MAQPPAGLSEAAERLDQATTELERTIDEVAKLPEKATWRQRSDDLGLLKEQVVDIRQQLELLKLELAREPEITP